MKSLFSNCIKVSVIALVFFLASCGEEKYPGYTEAEPGVYYKLHIPGESGKKAGPDDYYEVIMLNRIGNEVIYDSELESATGTMFMQSEASRYFSVLSEGDSATFLLPGGDLALPGMPDTGTIEMNIKVVSILTPEEMADRESQEDYDAGEALIIQRYITKKNLNVKPDSSGAVTIESKPGTGASPQKGDTVEVRIHGELLNGRVFDDSDSYGGFSFTWGDEAQVIPGIRLVLSTMKEGGYAKIILPSRLAFGNGGSVGIVPAHTPVVYTVELLHTR